MSESVANSSAAPSSANTKRYLIAALFSALAPGAGQLLLGQKRKGSLLLIAFVALCACLWPLRLPRFLAGLVAPLLAWFGLSIYAVCAALLESKRPDSPRISRWWLLITPPIVYVCFNLVFTPILLVAGFRALVFGSSSMEPSLPQGDYFMIDADYYHHRAVIRNDLVLIRKGGFRTVKRVIAVGGDAIEGRDQTILLNGEKLNEPFIEHTLPKGSNPQLDAFGPISVKAGQYFVMGDNRDVSLDSRTPDFGLVDAKAIAGMPLYIYRSPLKGRVGKKLR